MTLKWQDTAQGIYSKHKLSLVKMIRDEIGSCVMLSQMQVMHSAREDMKPLSALLDEIIKVQYDPGLVVVYEELKGSSSYLERPNTQLLIDIEELSKDAIVIINRILGAHLAIFGLLQRVHQSLNFFKDNHFSWNEFSKKGDVVPLKIYLHPHSYDFFENESVWIFEGIYQILYKYRLKTEAPFDDQALSEVRELFQSLLLSNVVATTDDDSFLLSRLSYYFTYSVGPAIVQILKNSSSPQREAFADSVSLGCFVNFSEHSDELLEKIHSYHLNKMHAYYKDSWQEIDLSLKSGDHPNIDFVKKRHEIDNILEGQYWRTDEFDRIQSLVSSIESDVVDGARKEGLGIFSAQMKVLGPYGMEFIPILDANHFKKNMNIIFRSIYQQEFDDFDFRNTLLFKALISQLMMLAKEHKDSFRALLDSKMQLFLGSNFSNTSMLLIERIEAPTDLVVVRIFLQMFLEKQPNIVPLLDTYEQLSSLDFFLNEYKIQLDLFEMNFDIKFICVHPYSVSSQIGYWSAQVEIQKILECFFTHSNSDYRGISFIEYRSGAVIHGGFPIQDVYQLHPRRHPQESAHLVLYGEAFRQRFGSWQLACVTLIHTYRALVTQFPQENYINEKVIKLQKEAINEFEFFVYEQQDFEDYFRAMTPSEVFYQQQTEKATRTKKALTELSWTLCWAQNRMMLPLWLGITPVFEAIERLTMEETQILFRNRFVSRSFMVVLMALVKADLSSFSKYQDELVSPHLKDFGFKLVKKFKKTQDQAQKILNLYEKDLYVQSICDDYAYRQHFLAPLHMIQIELLRRVRGQVRLQHELEKKVLESVLMISLGLQHTG